MKTENNIHTQQMFDAMKVARLKRRNEILEKALVAVLMGGSAVLLVLVMADILN